MNNYLTRPGSQNQHITHQSYYHGLYGSPRACSIILGPFIRYPREAHHVHRLVIFTRVVQDGIDVVIGTFAVYLLANIGLGFSNSFAALMVFRGIQAAGSAATISVSGLVYLFFETRLLRAFRCWGDWRHHNCSGAWRPYRCLWW